MPSGGPKFITVRKPCSERRKALGSFLADRRSRLSPAELGLAADRRRVPGLRREEVAVLAGVSVSWYVWLEQGRDIQASAAALRRLSAVLRLDRVETAHLFALSLREPPRFLASDTIAEGLTTLVSSLGSVPACVRNSRLDILAWNAAEADLFVDYGIVPPQERNTLRLLFLYKPYRTLLLNWERTARDMVGVFRAARARAEDMAPFDRLAEELHGISPEFRAWWPEVEVRGFEEGRLQLRHARRGSVDISYITLMPDGRPDLLLTICTPCPQVDGSVSYAPTAGLCRPVLADCVPA